MCDRCDKGWHMYCLEPKLESIPEGNWYCAKCAVHPDITAAREENKRVTPGAVPSHKQPTEPSKPITQQPREKKKVSWARPLTDSPSTAVSTVERPRSRAVRWSPDRPGESPPSVTPPVGSLRPSKAFRFPSQSVAASTKWTDDGMLPSYFQLSTTAGVMEALQALMPGPWTAEHATRIMKGCQGGNSSLRTAGQKRSGDSQRVDEMQRLMNAIDFGCVHSVTDMFAGNSIITPELGMRVITNDINPNQAADYHHDALQPDTYWNMRQQQGMDAIITIPKEEVLDLALPLAVKFAYMIVCCQVPGRYLTDAPEARMNWLRDMQQQGRLFFIMGLPRGPMGRRRVWLVVFKTRAISEWMRRPYAGFSTLLHYAIDHENIN